MRCSSCGADNREGARFCDSCGSPLLAACVRCGAALRPGARFCDSCGHPLSEDPGAAAGPPAGAQTPAAPDSAPVPKSFARGRYQVLRFLGEGGRKRVYLARDSRLDREVAVAVIKTDGLGLVGQERVKREAQAMARLGDHPNIVTVFDVSEEGGQPLLVSQYMAGGSVEDLVAKAEGHRLPVEDTLRICGQVCEALEYAHRQGIVHRDLKPGNVWLTGNSPLVDGRGSAVRV